MTTAARMAVAPSTPSTVRARLRRLAGSGLLDRLADAGEQLADSYERELFKVPASQIAARFEDLHKEAHRLLAIKATLGLLMDYPQGVPDALQTCMIDADGKPLFKPRRTQMAPVAWESRHHLQQLLYEAVTDYVREGYNQALREKKRHIGFLMILMQRLVVSSTRAIRTTLERRLAARAGLQRLL